MAMAACSNSAGLIASRVFLGIPEAGVVTCGVMYFSFWVRPSLILLTQVEKEVLIFQVPTA